MWWPPESRRSLSGPHFVTPKHLDSPLGRDKELARRLTLLQRVIDVPEESQEVPADGRPLGKGNGGNGAQRVLEADLAKFID